MYKLYCKNWVFAFFPQVLILQAGGRLALNRSLPYENPPHLLMSNLEPRHTYYIQVAAFNSRGTGPFSETLEVRPEPSLAHLGAVAGIAEDKGIAWITPLIIGTDFHPYLNTSVLYPPLILQVL